MACGASANGTRRAGSRSRASNDWERERPVGAGIARRDLPFGHADGEGWGFIQTTSWRRIIRVNFTNLHVFFHSRERYAYLYTVVNYGGGSPGVAFKSTRSIYLIQTVPLI